MTKNVGGIDRILRFIVGIVLLLAPFVAGWGTFWTVVSVAVALVMLGTAASRTCPLYSMIGVSTDKS